MYDSAETIWWFVDGPDVNRNNGILTCCSFMSMPCPPHPLLGILPCRLQLSTYLSQYYFTCWGFLLLLTIYAVNFEPLPPSGENHFPHLPSKPSAGNLLHNAPQSSLLSSKAHNPKWFNLSSWQPFSSPGNSYVHPLYNEPTSFLQCACSTQAVAQLWFQHNLSYSLSRLIK